jgi:membrane protein DedA with SNARE-associated domain
VTDQLLALLALYGLPALFGLLVVASAGVPLPVTLLLVVAGSFVAQGELPLWSVLGLGIMGAIVGDQIGYGVGRWGGRGFLRRITHRVHGDEQLRRATALSQRWGGAGVFFSRWLVTPLGPWLNLTSGATGYPWPRFLVWDVLGETLWVVLYVMLGKFFSDRVQELADLAGNLTWVIVGLVAIIILGWKLWQYFSRADAPVVSETSVPAHNLRNEQAG